MKTKQAELRNEVANCNAAIKAFKLGMKWLAPDGLADAPSVAWLQMQRALCIRDLDLIREGAVA